MPCRKPVLLWCLGAIATPAMPEAAQTPRVTIDTGTLAGRDADGVASFKGIPFAAPPLGDRRWKAPQPAAHWNGPRDATHYRSDCMQTPFPSDAAPLGTAPAEDCLYANVWRPSGTARSLPVMVWIYGGGFVNGGASPPTYAGTALARRGIVVVSFNYRLGRFGTFVHPQLTAAADSGDVIGNYGYMDQIAALRWVRRNVAAFGGDPRNVTIVGESAGGISVHTLVTSPMAKGLFARAVVQSGGPIPLGDTTLARAQAASLAFARSKGIRDDDPQALVKLRALSADAVTDGLNMAALFSPTSDLKTFSSPVVDGRLAVDSMAAYRKGRYAKVPIIIGATSADIGGPTGPMIVGARAIADSLAAQQVPIYYYRFSYVAASERSPEGTGARHATDIPFFLDTADVKYGAATTAEDRAAAFVASAYLVNFVRTGDPNGAGMPPWPLHTSRNHAMLDLTPKGQATLIEDR